ncbi:unnamed protein product [Rotaria sordida]|uniref:F-ATPase gamma subunit n=1 Tax=Rotaria sordida TaxID=392033 RepID=A0A814U917_9BILA|nr:unnamed protein product [Rotaria sordida]CAF3653958.1 unnamed protein product [Rotaria sordida]
MVFAGMSALNDHPNDYRLQTCGECKDDCTRCKCYKNNLSCTAFCKCQQDVCCNRTFYNSSTQQVKIKSNKFGLTPSSIPNNSSDVTPTQSQSIYINDTESSEDERIFQSPYAYSTPKINGIKTNLTSSNFRRNFQRKIMSFVVKAVGILQQSTTVALLWNGTSVRNMATLKDAAKYAKAERELRAVRSYGLSAKAFYDNLEVEKAEGPEKHLFIAATSDRGLCGAANSSIVKNIRTQLTGGKQNLEGKKKIVAIIDKSRTSAITYTTTCQKILSDDTISRSKIIQVYDLIDDDVLCSFQEFNLAFVLYYAMKENAISEQSSRMTAMDNTTKNARELINKLTTYYNRTRQAVITTELIEIISGAAALEQKN